MFAPGDIYCGEAFSTVLDRTSSKVADFHSLDCLIFDVDTFKGGTTTQTSKDAVSSFCGVSFFTLFYDFQYLLRI